MITTLLIKSKNRISGSVSNFKIKLPRSFKNVRCAYFTTFIIANTTYSIGSNDKFRITFNDNVNSPSILNITIPIGIYNIFELCSYIQSVINPIVVGTTVTFDERTNRIRFLKTGFTITIDNLQGNMKNILGFDSDSITDTGLIISERNPIGLDSPRMYLININEFISNSYILGNEQKEFNFYVLNPQGPNQLNIFDARSRPQVINVNRDLGGILNISIHDENMETMVNMTDFEMILQLEHDD
jgi:hypothetical protein